MKIIFMGTPDFAVRTLSRLCEAGHDVCTVITQPDRPHGRKLTVTAGPVAAEALRRGIPLLQPARIRGNEEVIAQIRGLAPDAIVVASFGQIIPQEILDIPKYGCFNVHASLLPAYRGAAPIQRALLDGCEKTGVTIMRMDAGLDTGDMAAVREVPISKDETALSLFEKLAAAGAELMAETLPRIESGEAVYTPQPKESTTPYAAMIRKEEGRIDWTKSAGEIERAVRALDPWPTAWTTLDGKTLKLWKAHVEKEGLAAEEGKCGCIVRQDAQGIYVQTGSGILVAEELQIEGRRRMKTGDFLRGYVIRNPYLGQS